MSDPQQTDNRRRWRNGLIALAITAALIALLWAAAGCGTAERIEAINAAEDDAQVSVDDLVARLDALETLFAAFVDTQAASAAEVRAAREALQRARAALDGFLQARRLADAMAQKGGGEKQSNRGLLDDQDRYLQDVADALAEADEHLAEAVRQDERGAALAPDIEAAFEGARDDVKTVRTNIGQVAERGREAAVNPILDFIGQTWPFLAPLLLGWGGIKGAKAYVGHRRKLLDTPPPHLAAVADMMSERTASGRRRMIPPDAQGATG